MKMPSNVCSRIKKVRQSVHLDGQWRLIPPKQRFEVGAVVSFVDTAGHERGRMVEAKLVDCSYRYLGKTDEGEG